MKLAYVFLFISTLMLAGCEKSQVNYGQTGPADRWMFQYTGNEMAWWTIGALIMMSLSNKGVDLADRK